MNSYHLSVLFVNLALLMGANGIFFTTTGTGAASTVVYNGALTIPLVTATSGTLATPLAVLGVLKLGAALAFALGYLGTNGDDDGYAYRRRESRARQPIRQKRESGDILVPPNPEALFALVAAMDTYNCGKQLVCELEAKSVEALAADELLMLRLFGDRKMKKNVNPASPKAEYDLAAELGMASKSQVLCRERYSTCPYTAVEMMDALRNSHL